MLCPLGSFPSSCPPSFCCSYSCSLGFFFFFGCTLNAVVPHPLLWKWEVLTTGPSGNSPLFLFFIQLFLLHLCFSRLKNCSDLLSPFFITRPSHSSRNIITSADTQMMGTFMVPFFRQLIKSSPVQLVQFYRSVLQSATVTPLSLRAFLGSSGPCLSPPLLSGSPPSFSLSLCVSFSL